jgi:hypothetical protein
MGKAHRGQACGALDSERSQAPHTSAVPAAATHKAHSPDGVATSLSSCTDLLHPKIDSRAKFMNYQSVS